MLSDKFYAMAKCYRMEEFNRIMTKVVKLIGGSKLILKVLVMRNGLEYMTR